MSPNISIIWKQNCHKYYRWNDMCIYMHFSLICRWHSNIYQLPVVLSIIRLDCFFFHQLLSADRKLAFLLYSFLLLFFVLIDQFLNLVDALPCQSCLELSELCRRKVFIQVKTLSIHYSLYSIYYLFSSWNLHYLNIKPLKSSKFPPVLDCLSQTVFQETLDSLRRMVFRCAHCFWDIVTMPTQ